MDTEQHTMDGDDTTTKAPPTFREHHEKADAFCEECNEELRRRGFHNCEARVDVDWFGVIRLWRYEMTNVLGRDGVPQIFKINCPLPNPWALPEPMSAAEILNHALASCNESAMALCTRHKALRLGFAAYGRAVSATIAVPGNGSVAKESRIVVS